MSTEVFHKCPGCGQQVAFSRYELHIRSNHKDGLEQASQSPQNPQPPPGGNDERMVEDSQGDKNMGVLQAIGFLMADKKHAKGLLWWTLLFAGAIAMFFFIRGL